MRGHDQGVLPHLNPVAIEICAGCTRQHHAWPVVAVENQRTLDRALRQYHLRCTNLPHAFARRTLRNIGQMVGQALAQADEILVIIANRGRARE